MIKEDIILTENSVIALKKSIAVRYEHNFNNGTVILIDTETDNIWYGNKESLLLIKELRNRENPQNIETICSKIISEYSDSFSTDIIIESLSNLLNDLYEKKFIDIISL